MDRLIVMLLQIIPYCAVLLFLIAAAWAGLRILRAKLAKTEYQAAGDMESFKKLYDEGKITEEEFRIIRRLVSLQVFKKTERPNNNRKN